MKICIKCKVSKPVSEFYRTKENRDGYFGRCKTCIKERARHLRLKNPTLYKKKYLEYYAANRERCAESRRKFSETAAGRASIKRGGRKWALKNKHKRIAHMIVYKAVARGDMIRMPCEICGADNSEAHHEDYSKPLHVMWLCREHHRDRHSQLNGF